MPPVFTTRSFKWPNPPSNSSTVHTAYTNQPTPSEIPLNLASICLLPCYPEGTSGTSTHELRDLFLPKARHINESDKPTGTASSVSASLHCSNRLSLIPVQFELSECTLIIGSIYIKRWKGMVYVCKEKHLMLMLKGNAAYMQTYMSAGTPDITTRGDLNYLRHRRSRISSVHASWWMHHSVVPPPLPAVVQSVYRINWSDNSNCLAQVNEKKSVLK